MPTLDFDTFVDTYFLVRVGGGRARKRATGSGGARGNQGNPKGVSTPAARCGEEGETAGSLYKVGGMRCDEEG
jgi:hypothetical protein